MLATCLELAGAMMCALAGLHVLFPKRFNWRRELAALSLLNRQIMQVHTFFIALTVALMGVLCLTSAAELAGTRLGARLCLGLAVFWTARLYVQLFIYSSALWRKKRFETAVHILFAMTWTYFSVLFWWGATPAF